MIVVCFIYLPIHYMVLTRWSGIVLVVALLLINAVLPSLSLHRLNWWNGDMQVFLFFVFSALLIFLPAAHLVKLRLESLKSSYLEMIICISLLLLPFLFLVAVFYANIHTQTLHWRLGLFGIEFYNPADVHLGGISGFSSYYEYLGYLHWFNFIPYRINSIFYFILVYVFLFKGTVLSKKLGRRLEK